MGFSNNNMLCFYVLAAFLAVGDCTLSPIVRPFLSLLNAPHSTLGNNRNPSLSSYPYPVSSGRWGGGKMDAPVIIPKVTTLDGGLSSNTPVAKVIKTHPRNPQMDVWTNKPEVSYKYLNKMRKYDGVPKVTVSPLKKGKHGLNKGWLIDGSGRDLAKKPVILTPLKDGSRRMMLIQKNDVDSYSGEDGDLMKYGSNELGSNEESWKTTKFLTPTPMDGENMEHDMPNEDLERIVIIEKPISSWSHTSHNHLWRGYKMARNGKSACPYCNEANMV